MPKHSIFNRTVKKEPRPAVHPMWRGIGLILIVVIPGLSFLATNILFVNRTKLNWFIIPEKMISHSLKDPYIFVKVLYTVLISLVVFFIIALVTFSLDRIVNPKRKGPFDV